MEPGIYLEIKPANSSNPSGDGDFKLGDFKHAYLVYRKADGTSEVIRGGLGKNRKISVETRKSLEKSKDALEAGEKPGSRPSRKLEIPIEKLDETWSKMRDKAESIGKEAIDYRADPFPSDPDQTSNSVIRAALDEARVPLEKALPDGVTPDKLPGIRDNLTEKIEETRREREETRREREETRRERERPNPIEGEIGGTDDQKPTPPAPSENDPVDPSDSGSESGANKSELIAGTDAGDDLEDASPETRKFMKNLLEPGDTVDEIMLKRPEDLTEGEAKEIMIARMDATTEDERERLFKAEKGFFDHFFGDEPAGTDAVGRTMEPKPIRPIPEEPKPVATADGRPLEIGLRRIGRKVVRDAKDDGLASVIKRLQGGLNLLGEAKAPKDGAAPLAKLNEDGVFGPKSRFSLRRAVTTLGVPKVEEGLALGGFGEFARDGRKQGFERLREATEKNFAPLFQNPANTVRRPAERIEAVTLQEALNDLGRSQSGGKRFTPLILDGDIGPRTTETFGQLINALGHGPVTKRFGELLGFL